MNFVYIKTLNPERATRCWGWGGRQAGGVGGGGEGRCARTAYLLRRHRGTSPVVDVVL